LRLCPLTILFTAEDGENNPCTRESLRKPLFILALTCALPLMHVHGQQRRAAQRDTDWPAYAHDALGSRRSALTDVTRTNVQNLRVAWTFSTGEAALPVSHNDRFSLETTPIMVDGVLYATSPLGRVFALDPATGKLRWEFDPHVDQGAHFGDFTNRGAATWLDPAAQMGARCRRTIFVATIDARLIALDAATGTPCTRFGDAGTVDLKRGLRNGLRWKEEYEETSPPTVVNGLIVVGSAVADNNRVEAASGEVRAFDARTGELRWTWDPVTRDSLDKSYRTWNGARAHHTGAANAWTVLAADPQRDLVFIPTSSPSPDYYGGERLGANRHANSIVALRASTGKLVWAFQTVHHDLWDFDNASPPALITIRRNGRRVPAVVQATKTGQLFVLDRMTGVPVFPVEEREVPQTDVRGEWASSTQPFSSIEPLSPHRLTANDAWGITDADRSACRDEMSKLRAEGIFTPPSLRGTLVIPSNVGGAHWGGVAYDPVRQIVVVPVNRIAAEVQLIPREEMDSMNVRMHRGERMEMGGDWEYAEMDGTPYGMRRRILRAPSGLPCTPPPFGTLVAVSLATGRKMWEVPLGTMSELVGRMPGYPANDGSPNLGGAITTAGGLIFIGASIDHKLHAYDIESGKLLWTGDLPAGAKASPMTYRVNGKQYIVIAAGGGNIWGRGDSIVAFALP
jgi:quinoprotein glucose dehydrogenase